MAIVQERLSFSAIISKISSSLLLRTFNTPCKSGEKQHTDCICVIKTNVNIDFILFMALVLAYFC